MLFPGVLPTRFQTDDVGRLLGPRAGLALDLMANKALRVGQAPYEGNAANLLTFSRPSRASFFDQGRVLRQAEANEIRFDHGSVTGAARGVLNEGQRTNLLKSSAVFDAVDWTKSGVVVGVDAVLAPDGSASADRLTKTASAFRHVSQGFSASTGPYVASVYLRADTLEIASLLLSGDEGSTLHARAVVDLSTGQVTDFNSTNLVSASAEKVDGGWWRFSVAANLPVVTNPRLFIYPGIYSEAVAGSVLAWGAQVEAGFFPTSYIPTTTAAATRAEDQISAPNDGWLRPDVGSLVLEWESAGFEVGTIRPLVRFGEGVFNGVGAHVINADRIDVISRGTAGATSHSFSTKAGVNCLAMAWAPGRFAASVNGSAVLSGMYYPPVGDVPQLYLGQGAQLAGSSSSVRKFNGWFRNAVALPVSLTDAELVARSVL